MLHLHVSLLVAHAVCSVARQALTMPTNIPSECQLSLHPYERHKSFALCLLSSHSV